MKTMQTWGWLAAGVLAAGLNASYHDGGLEWAHRIADRVTDRVEEASSMVHDLTSRRADLFLTEARLFLAHDQDASSRTAMTLVRIQSRITRSQMECAHAEAQGEEMSARHQAALDRAEAERNRMEAQRQRMEDKMEADRDRLEARLAELHIPANLTTAAFTALQPPVCPRVRVRLPRMPKIMISAPAIHVEAHVDPI
jgi:hypothetical protein